MGSGGWQSGVGPNGKCAESAWNEATAGAKGAPLRRWAIEAKRRQVPVA